jgi:hypothetical protein
VHERGGARSKAIRTTVLPQHRPRLAEDGGITFEQFQQFVGYTRTPSDEVLCRLAGRLRVFEKV